MPLSFPTTGTQKLAGTGIQQTKAGSVAQILQILEMASDNFGIAEDGVHLKSQHHHTDKLLITVCHRGE